MYSRLNALFIFGSICFITGFALDSRSSMDTIFDDPRILGNNEVTLDKLGQYSIKFQGCHRIAQWKYEEKSNSHIYFQHLVRFRLCPSGHCSNDTSNGCNTHYGEYLLDINTFLYYYLTTGSVDASNTNYYVDSIKPSDYTTCSALKNFGGYSADNTDQYYVGPYCSKQGGSIYLGLFTDSECSIMSKCDSACFKGIMGYPLPYSQQPLVYRNCVACSSSSGQTYYGPSYECKQIYKQAGKCESRMDIENPNLSACKYISGVKMTGENGVLRNSNAGRGKVTLLIASLAVCCLIIGLYIIYLRKSTYLICLIKLQQCSLLSLRPFYVKEITHSEPTFLYQRGVI